MSKLLNIIPILVAFTGYSSCQRSSAAKAEPKASPCFAILSDDGFHDLVCDGQPIKQRPGPKGDPGERGPTGGQGPKGDPGSGGRTVVNENECIFELPAAPGNKLTMKLNLFVYSDDFVEVSLHLANLLSGEIFQNSALLKPGSFDPNNLPSDLNEFQVRLVAENKATVRNIATGVTKTFACVRN